MNDEEHRKICKDKDPDNCFCDLEVETTLQRLQREGREYAMKEYVYHTEELDHLIANTYKETLKEVEGVIGMNTREMNVGENRSKYLAFQRGERHMQAKIQTKLTNLISGV